MDLNLSSPIPEDVVTPATCSCKQGMPGMDSKSDDNIDSDEIDVDEARPCALSRRALGWPLQANAVLLIFLQR